MLEELKIRIHNHKEVEKHLLGLGGIFIEEISAIDTYFKQPRGNVLKVTEDNRGNFLVSLKSVNGKFQIDKQEPIVDLDEVKSDLSDKFGIKCVLKKSRRFFKFGKYSININLIEEVGEFLLVEGKRLTSEVITEKLKIQNPEFIAVSFDELRMENRPIIDIGVISNSNIPSN